MPTTINPSDQTITQYNIQTGGASNLLNNVAPSATSGVPVISQGAASQPVFGTAVVAGGGTGATSFTAYAVICGGTTSTGTLQSIAGVGTAGQVLTSNGAAALPTFQAAGGGGGGITKVVTRVFTTNATYTPTSGMVYATVQIVGGGGGGGGYGNAGANATAGGGGAGGGYAQKTYTAAQIGVSKAVVIGAGGSGGGSGSDGNSGSNSTFDSGGLNLIGNGGVSGKLTNASTGQIAASLGGQPTGGSNGDFQAYGSGGGAGTAYWDTGTAYGWAAGGTGGSTFLGGGSSGSYVLQDGTTNAGLAAINGAGGGGGSAIPSSGASNNNGQTGASGLCVITEYCT